MKTAKELFFQGKQILRQSGNEAYAFDAACLFMHFCGISRKEIAFTEKIPENEEQFIAACKKRADGYPLQYILGAWEFYGLEFELSPDVLIPRADTETLIDYVLERYNGDIKILDMCCGSGCIGLTLKKHLENAQVTLCDISDGALDITRKNAKRLDLCVNIKKADLTKGFVEYFEKESFDIIISNPPYITDADMKRLQKEVQYEPKIALQGGQDGMDFYRALISDWKGALKIGGEMILETGYDTADAVAALFTELEYTELTTKKDFGGVMRVAAAKKGRYND